MLAARRFSATSSVRHVEIDGLRIILDLSTESYRVLDDVASALWAVLVGEADAAGSFDDLARHYQIDHGRLRAEVTTFADRCVAAGMLEPAGTPLATEPVAPRAPARGRGGTLQALKCLIATQRALARDGFRTTYDRYARFSTGWDAPPLDVVLRGFSRAENFFIARRAPGDCLVRSLSLYRYLRAANVPAEHVIGVRRFPFRAHAWVECSGSPVFDERSHDFTPLARIGNPPQRAGAR